MRRTPNTISQFATFVLNPEPARLIHALYPIINVPPGAPKRSRRRDLSDGRPPG